MCVCPFVSFFVYSREFGAPGKRVTKNEHFLECTQLNFNKVKRSTLGQAGCGLVMMMMMMMVVVVVMMGKEMKLAGRDKLWPCVRDVESQARTL